VGAAVGTALMAARTADDRIISALPFFHVYGSSVFNAAMIAGSRLIVIPRFDAVTVLSGIQRHRATMMDGGPTAYYYLLAHPDFDKYDLSSLYPAEIERVLCMHPAVALAAVGSVLDEVTGELAKAYVILKPGVVVARADLVAHCRASCGIQSASRVAVCRVGTYHVIGQDHAEDAEGSRRWIVHGQLNLLSRNGSVGARSCACHTARARSPARRRSDCRSLAVHCSALGDCSGRIRKPAICCAGRRRYADRPNLGSCEGRAIRKHARHIPSNADRGSPVRSYAASHAATQMYAAPRR
jgi:acyl-CoA synthetase (AMP-forming)/AMP-acid ligase II